MEAQYHLISWDCESVGTAQRWQSITSAGFLRMLLLAFAILVTAADVDGIPDEETLPTFTLLMGGTLGMMLMASANHLLMVFIAVEMASLPSYMAGFLKGRRQSSGLAQVRRLWRGHLESCSMGSACSPGV